MATPKNPWDPKTAHEAYNKRQGENLNDKTHYAKKNLFGKENVSKGRDAEKESKNDKKRWR